MIRSTLAAALILISTGAMAQPPNPPQWNLLTVSRTGAVSLIKNLTQAQCETARTKVTGADAAAAYDTRYHALQERYNAWTDKHKCAGEALFLEEMQKAIPNSSVYAAPNDSCKGTVISDKERSEYLAIATESLATYRSRPEPCGSGIPSFPILAYTLVGGISVFTNTILGIVLFRRMRARQKGNVAKTRFWF